MHIHYCYAKLSVFPFSFLSTNWKCTWKQTDGNAPFDWHRETKSKWKSKTNSKRKYSEKEIKRPAGESLHRNKVTGIQTQYKLVLLHDFLADVKDWMFPNLLLLNLDKLGLFRGKKSLNDFSLSSVLPHALPPLSLSLSPSFFISLFLSFPPLYSSFLSVLFISEKKHLWLVFGQSHLEAKSEAFGSVCLSISSLEYTV